MRVLGISDSRPYSAAICVDNHKIVGGHLESKLSGKAGDSAFPALSISELLDYNKPFDYVCYTGDSSKIKQPLKALGISAPIVQFSTRDALAQSAITVNKLYDTKKAIAILVVDDFETSIGYYSEELHWTKTFSYPNSLCLFYSAAARFLGFNPMLEEHKVEQLAAKGTPLFSDVIKNNIIKIDTDSYELLLNLERGLGVAGESADIASSVVQVYNEIILNLLHYIKTNYDLSSLIFVGRGSEKPATIAAIQKANLFENIYLGTDCSNSGIAIGAAALQTKAYFKSQYIGKDFEKLTLPDSIADSLLRGNIVDYNYGKDAFSPSYLGSKNKLTIPFKPLLDKLKNPVALVLEQDYNTYFSNYSGLFANTPATVKSDYIPNTTKIRCIKINSSSNPYLARIITLTRAQGFPILVFSDNE
jgi:predicted NodU family carbamoyl transferase